MSSKRFKKLPKGTNNLKAEPINNLLQKVKENCTTKFDESLDLNILINNKQKKNEINLIGGDKSTEYIKLLSEINNSEITTVLTGGNSFETPTKVYDYIALNKKMQYYTALLYKHAVLYCMFI